MNNASISTIQYPVRRLTIDVALPVHELRARYEAAVPQYPESEVKALIARRASWQEMLDLNADIINGDLLAFVQEAHHATSGARAEERNGADRSLAGRA